MDRILNNTIIPVNNEIFIKDPLSSGLGKKIIDESLVLILALGMEAFNFKKLSEQVGCTEAAVYRYFENKHKLLLYLTNWYWGWLEYNLVYGTANINNPTDKIKMAINLLVEGPVFNKNLYMDIGQLRKVITEESNKAFMTKDVDIENKGGLFNQFYNFSDRLVQIILEFNPNYTYPKAFASTLIWATIVNAYYFKHMPKMVEDKFSGKQKEEFYFNMVVNSLKNE